MNRSTVRTPVWQLALVLLGAPALEALFFVASGVSFETFSRFAFIWGAPTEYIVFAVVLLFLRRSHVSLADLGLTGDGWRRRVDERCSLASV